MIALKLMFETENVFNKNSLFMHMLNLYFYDGFTVLKIKIWKSVTMYMNDGGIESTFEEPYHVLSI